MRFCLIGGWACLAATFLAAAESDESVRRFTSAVRADPRSGRLVRTVTVSPRLVQPREIKARAADSEPSRSALGASRVEQFVEQTAERFQVDPLLVHSVIQVESNYNPFAVSTKGALGMMQLMPGTARRFAVRDAFNPWENIEGGVRYLKYLQGLFGDVRLVLAAYNAGEGAVFKYGGLPPYPETTQYVYKVGKKLGQAERAADAKARQQSKTSAETHVEAFEDSRGTLHLRTRSAQ